MPRRSVTAALALLLVLGATAGAPAVAARAGDLDPTFGSGGTYTRTALTTGELPLAVGVQPDGSVLVAGSSRTSTTTGARDAEVLRLTPAGAPDPTFGTGGTATLHLGDRAIFQALALQPDGRVVLSGYVETGSSTESLLARYTAGGQLDAGFFGTGRRTQQWSGAGSRSTAVAVLADGGIVAAGSTASGSDFALGRFTAAGDNGAAFGGTGNSFFTDAVSPGNDLIAAIAAYADGRLVVVGRTTAADGVTEAAVVRYLANGQRDTSFSGDGLATLRLGTDSTTAVGVAIRPDGRIVVMGGAEDSTGARRTVLAQLVGDGSLDQSFGTGGTVSTALTDHDVITAGALGPDGSVVVTGTTDDGGRDLVARFTTVGARDAGFGDGGVVLLPLLSSADSTTAVTVAPDAKVVTAGFAERTGRVDPVVVRLVSRTDPPPVLVPSSRVSVPSSGKVSARKLRAITGTAGPTGAVARVEVAIRRVDKRLLKKKRKCVWVRDPHGRTRKTKAVDKVCSAPVWLPAAGTTSYSFALSRSLAPGTYVVYSRATLTTGATETTFSAGVGNQVTVKVTSAHRPTRRPR